MSESILTSVKMKAGSGIPEGEHHFDDMIIDYINSGLAELHQVGVGKTPFFITGDLENWDDFVEDKFVQNLCKVYLAKNVELAFNPSSSSAMTQATKEICERL